MKRVVIIGGGIAGLSAAYSLREHQKDGAAFEILILERKAAVGGNIKTEKVDGFIVEGGPDCFLSEKPWAMELCRRIGMEDRFLSTNDSKRKTFVLSGGKLHELPEGVILMVPTKILPLVTSTLISFRGKLRMAMEMFIPRKKTPGDESLGQFVRRRLGKEALDKIAEPLVAGVHAGDPETMSIRSSFPKFVQLEEEHGSLIRGMVKKMATMRKAPRPASAKKKVTMFMTLSGGLTEMIETLVTLLKKSGNTEIRTGVDVTGVEKKGEYYEVSIYGAPSIKADSVIIAVPAYAASTLLKGLDPWISERLSTIPYVSTATVSNAFKKKDVAHPLNGFGFVVPKTENRKIMAATWTSVKFSGRAPENSILIRCFVGGSKNTELVDMSDADMVKMVRAELKDIMSIDAEPVLTRVFKWKNSMPQYTIGHDERIASMEEKLAKYHGLYLAGSAYHGIGIADSVRFSEVVAKKALHHIGN